MSYDYRMLLNTVSGTDNYVTGTTYDASGRMELRALGNGLQSSYDYFNWDDPAYVLQNGNTQGRLAAVQSGTGLYPDSLQELTYSYDPVGNVTGISDDLAGPQSQTFSYDSVYRLTQGYTTGGTGGFYDESYTYDASTGNLSSKAGVSYGYQDTNHFHAVTHLDSVQKYWYDANGNMIERIVGGDSYELTYDADNRLVEVEKNQTTVGEYTYDGDGSRVKSVAGGVTTYYIGNYYEWRVEASGATGVNYYYAGSQRVAMRVGTALSYLFGDHLGSTSITTEASGSVSGELRYLPFGETRYTSGQTPTSFRYTGQRESAESGLYFYGARWYDSVLGRWAQPDTLIPSPGNPMAWDRYAYVMNSPIRYSDPSGHRATVGSGIDEFDDLFIERTIDDYKDRIKNLYGITISDGVRTWSFHDVVTMYIALERMNSIDEGFEDRVTGSTLYYDFPDKVGSYSGFTIYSTITFYADSGKIPYQNIYHEFGHLIDNNCDSRFSKALDGASISADGEFVFGRQNGKYNRQDGVGYKEKLLWDPNRHKTVVTEQHPRSMDADGNTAREEWADMWANYVAGNIDLDSSAGAARNGWITDVLK